MDPDPHNARCEPDGEPGPPPPPASSPKGRGKPKRRENRLFAAQLPRDPELSRRAARAPGGARSPRSQPGSACAAGARSRPPPLLFNRPRCASSAWMRGDRLDPFPAGHTMGPVGPGRPGSTRSQARRNGSAPRRRGDPSELARRVGMGNSRPVP